MTYEEMERSLQGIAQMMDREGREWRERTERLERSIQELRDAQLVQVHMMDRREREWDERITRLSERVVSHEDGIGELRAAMAQLFRRMDRFIQGLERENGHN